MLAWSVVAVGAVYDWGAAALMLAALPLAVLASPERRPDDDTHTVDALLVLSVLASAVPLVPLPLALLSAVSPRANAIAGAIRQPPFGAAVTWQPASISPASTAKAIGLAVAALIVFWAARTCCARGLTPRIVRAIALTGLCASLAALVLQTAGDRTLIYGRWPPLDAGAHPFGPFVNRNHFATWVVMACPLAIGYVASTFHAAASQPGARRALRAAIEWVGTSAAWVGASIIVMLVALVMSTSRSGLIALVASLASFVWLASNRLTRRAALHGFVGAAAGAALVVTYASVQPVLSRLEETLRVGVGPRWRIWLETLRIVHDFPVVGTGLGGYGTAMLVYQRMDRAVFINQAHNQYLHLLVEGGLLVTIPIALTVVAFVRLFRTRLATDVSPSFWLRIGGASAMIAVAVQGLWETGLRIPANGLLFAVAAAVAVHRAE